MSNLLIENGIVVTLNSENKIYEQGSVYIEGDRIVEVGIIPAGKYSPDKTLDASGKVVMPGLINVHHHLYSTLARGFAPPGEPAANFEQILKNLWWKLDFALNEKDLYYSALFPLIQAIRTGCTTIIDHHASPSCVDGSLDILADVFREIGLSGSLCYEVSDRNHKGEGITENERFINKCQASGDDQVTAMFGLHALLTLGTQTLERCAQIGSDYDVGFHVHVAEAEVDVSQTRKLYDTSVAQRFHDFAMTGEKSLFVHGVELDQNDYDLLASSRTMLASAPESNMNNGLAIAPVLDMLNRGILVGLGTDGMSSHMFSQMRAVYLSQRGKLRDPRVAFAESCEMLLKNNATIAGRIFKTPRGVLQNDYLADVILLDYIPFTPFNSANFFGHLLFGLSYSSVDTTIARGKILMSGGKLENIDEVGVSQLCRENTVKLWQRIEALS